MMEITVNDAVIQEADIARETQYHPASSFEEARQKAARALAVRALLLQRADRIGLASAEDTDEARIAALIAREVHAPRADEQTCRRYFESHGKRFRSPDLFEAVHILFAVRPDDQKAFEQARAKAEEVITVLTAQPERFGEYAKALSACPSGKQGGNLGQLTRGSTVPEVETFLMQLEPGQLCPVPVRSRYGFHVLRLERRIDGKPLPFETVAEKIAAYLEERAWRQAVSQYIQILAGSAQITGVALKHASSPLVQ
jgi:peptidyl-prolyl cis-trans isomerase C